MLFTVSANLKVNERSLLCVFIPSAIEEDIFSFWGMSQNMAQHCSVSQKRKRVPSLLVGGRFETKIDAMFHKLLKQIARKPHRIIVHLKDAVIEKQQKTSSTVTRSLTINFA